MKAFDEMILVHWFLELRLVTLIETSCKAQNLTNETKQDMYPPSGGAVGKSLSVKRYSTVDWCVTRYTRVFHLQDGSAG